MHEALNELKEYIREDGYRVVVVHDLDMLNPREEYDNIGTILYTSFRYLLGDRRVSLSEIEEIQNRKGVLWLPVYAYIHSGVILSTGSFSCPWDSGQSGIIYMESEDIKKHFGGDRDKARECLVSEVETFSRYLSGEVYGVLVYDDTGEEVFSLWGMYSMDEAADEGISYCDHNPIPKMCVQPIPEHCSGLGCVTL